MTVPGLPRRMYLEKVLDAYHVAAKIIALPLDGMIESAGEDPKFAEDNRRLFEVLRETQQKLQGMVRRCPQR